MTLLDIEKNLPAKEKPAKPASINRRLQNRDKLETEILEQAVRLFAECGYEGTSIATIAEQVGLSKQNLLYYFPSKQALYQRVLDDVLNAWLERMNSLADDSREPEELLRDYIVAKLRFSRERPWGSRVYAMEVIGGAKVYGADIRKKVVPLLRKDIEIFEKWITEGKIAAVNPTHLLFAIWAMTQSYADFATQMSLVMNRKQLNKKDFDDAEKLIVDMVLAGLALKPA
ncbi:TetR/AcrR family transcriptional regulator [Undibacterium sp. Jales W-56]|uniref:TetR/AcrR family transcriptional regulator n=1 Tax=Undibacterium sp. Jales W-56 TaxID=2897325 RepID=UPI0021CF0B4D|nr:TetR/AcrR family transcriptional regulator [Undibacterium sp. Jales W-56]MCU6432372.1 TetR/AcrR family transcriptional regulator [Undibacterium sp. Jales W-56]